MSFCLLVWQSLGGSEFAPRLIATAEPIRDGGRSAVLGYLLLLVGACKISGFELGSVEVVRTRDRCGSFSKVAIVSAVLGRDSLVVVCVASLVVVVEGILVVGSPLVGLAGLPLALRRGCRSRWGKVGYHLWSLEDAMCHLKDSIDSGCEGGFCCAIPRKIADVSTVGSGRTLYCFYAALWLYWPWCAGGSCSAIPREIADFLHQCKKSHNIDWWKH